MKINKTSNKTIRLRNVNSFSNDKIKPRLTSRLDTIQAEIDQATESRMTTVEDTILRKDNPQPAVKEAMDQPQIYSMYLLPPFI